MTLKDLWNKFLDGFYTPKTKVGESVVIIELLSLIFTLFAVIWITALLLGWI